ncbi:MAG: radical SAM protein [Theionarchaea archaeon]|nr:radical SAM protein [Theionarchaea archaeon]MBU6999351.1 radical SAM protein [Theionarchaea archaeon]MBU7021811.1 radical SAM protein [Theionarchaea archaeon]MBU7034142.1 radical SAM protein [Theionarchaea archaeon]MBU7040022.1 radical SAM protein [Theionarchaea archaeon]
MRVLLIQPPRPYSSHDSDWLNSTPIGLAYIAAVLREAGHTIDVLDMPSQGLTPESVEGVMRRFRPEVVGCSVATVGYLPALRALTVCKRCDPTVTTILGGIHATFEDTDAASQESVDYVVRNEGEHTIVQLLDCIEKQHSPQALRGITYHHSTLVRAEDAPPVSDLDALPFPAHDLFPLSHYPEYGMVAVNTSRGCAHKCIFCSTRSMFRTYRFRSAESVVEELKYVHELYPKKKILVGDDTFTLNRKRAMKICSLIREEGLDIDWNCETRVDTIDDEMLSELKKAGCYAVYYGLETGSQENLDRVRKGTTVQKGVEAVGKAFSAGIDQTLVGFILGFPWEKEADIEKSIALVLHLRKKFGLNLIAYGKFPIPFPGTELVDMIEQGDITVYQGMYQNWEDYQGYKPIMVTEHIARNRLHELYLEFCAACLSRPRK